MSTRRESKRKKKNICYKTGFPVILEEAKEYDEEEVKEDGDALKKTAEMPPKANNYAPEITMDAKINTKSKGNASNKHEKKKRPINLNKEEKKKKASTSTSKISNDKKGEFNQKLKIISTKTKSSPTKNKKATKKLSQDPNLLPPYPFYKDVHNSTTSTTSNENDYTYREGIESVANLLKHKKNIIVLAGAGISVSCGIPDFRSKDTGLYSTLDAQGLGLNCAEDLFDLEFFSENPRPFYRFARNLYPGSIAPSTSHKFLALLEERKMLLRVYTQNIDGLEEVAGVSPKKIVYAHGSLTWAQCMKCRRKVDAKEISKDVMAGIVPRCTRPALKRKVSSGSVMSSISAASSVSSASSTIINKRPRRMAASSRLNSYSENDNLAMMDDENDNRWSLGSSVSLGDTGGKNGVVEEEEEQRFSLPPSAVCGGVIKPGVTFFGEKLDDKVARCLKSDHAKADALIVMGTSLSVAPMSKVIQYLPPSIPRILINRNIVKTPKHSSLDEESDQDEEEGDFREGYVFDACLLGFCDDVTRCLVKEMSPNDYRKSLVDDSTSSIHTEHEGKILSSTRSHDDNAALDRCIHHHPPERVFLFPGAVIDRDDSDSDVTYKEVAHCDGCQKQISGKIMKCMECFDFDLCVECYPDLRKSHCGGKHKFVAE